MPEIDNRITIHEFAQLKKDANNITRLLFENEINRYIIEGIRLSFDIRPFNEDDLELKRRNDRMIEYLQAIRSYILSWIEDGNIEKERLKEG